jgi:hypothetical protein
MPVIDQKKIKKGFFALSITHKKAAPIYIEAAHRENI